MNSRNARRVSEAFTQACRYIQLGNLTAFTGLLAEFPTVAHWRDRPAVDGARLTLLHEAAQWVHYQEPATTTSIVEQLVAAGADVQAPLFPKGGVTPLHVAAAANNVAAVQQLLKAGATECRAAPEDPISTPLGYALFYGYRESCPVFPLHSAEVLVRNGAHLSLPLAAAMGRLDILHEFFLARCLGTSKGKHDAIRIQQALLFASLQGQIPAVRYLLERGVNVNGVALLLTHQATALHLACERGQQVELVRLLITAGADLRARDGVYGATPEGWAMFNGQDQVFRLLRRFQASA